MVWDTVSFSLKNTYQDNTVYNTWLNNVKNGRAQDTPGSFKDFLLTGNNLQLFAKHFDDYQEGDMFVKESVVELEKNKLLCFDADQAQAYIIDLNDMSKDRDQISMTVFKPKDTTADYDKQIQSLVTQISTKLGSDFKTVDGTKLSLEYITSNVLSSKSLEYYKEAIAKKNGGTDSTNNVDTSTVDIDTNNLKNIAYYNLNDITNNEKEFEYYKYLLQSMGVSVDESNEIDKGQADTVYGALNQKINAISKYLNSPLTLAPEAKKNLIELFRQLSLSEINIIEKLNPGLLETVGNFIGDYKPSVYMDKYGNKTAISQAVGWDDLMLEKKNMQNDPLAYLNFEDRAKAISEYTVATTCNVKDGKVTIDDKPYEVKNGKVKIDGTEYTVKGGQVKIGDTTYGVIDKKQITISGTSYEVKDGKVTIDGKEYTVQGGKIEINTITVNDTTYAVKNGKVTIKGKEYPVKVNEADNTIQLNVMDYQKATNKVINSNITVLDKNGNATTKGEAAKTLAGYSTSDKSTAAVETSRYISNKATNTISDSYLQEMIDKFKNYVKAGKSDKALLYLAGLSNPEVVFRLLANEDVYNALGKLGTKKGTLGAGKNQTCDIYVLDDNDNIRCDNDGQPVKMQNQPLNALNIANHLFAMAKIYQASKIDENGNYIGGDAEKIADCKVLDSIQALRDGIKNGENVKFAGENGAKNVAHIVPTGIAFGGLTFGTLIHDAAKSTITNAANEADKVLNSMNNWYVTSTKKFDSFNQFKTIDYNIKAVNSKLKNGKDIVNNTNKLKTLKKAKELAKIEGKTKNGFNSAKTVRALRTVNTSSKTVGVTWAGAGMMLSGTMLGAEIGVAVGDHFINNDKAGDFIDEDGNFCKKKAIKFKVGTGFCGGGLGLGISSLTAIGLGLVSGPVGWTCLTIGAVAFAGGLIGSILHKKNGKKE